MLRASLVACVALSLAACGSKIPQHNGYKTKTPWKKPKSLKLDDKLEAKAKGELDYAAYKRARWYALELGEDGTLNLALEFTPLDEAENATVAMEVLDAGFRVISEDEEAPLEAPPPEDDEEDEEDYEDEEEDDDGEGGETQKTRTLEGLPPGVYYVHLFVTGRLDIAEYKLAASFVPEAKPVESNFPKDVAFVPPLPIVPVEDEAPAPEKPPGKKPPRGGGGKKPPKDKEPEEKDTGTAGAITALIIAANPNGSGGTDITINVGQGDGVEAGRSGSIVGVKNGGFTLSSCGQKSCKASVKASIDQVKGSKMEVRLK